MRINRENHKEAQRYPEKIVQFGEGNFLRAFVDWIVYRMNKQCGFNAGVTVVQPIAHGMVDKLNEQDGLYTLYLRGIVNGKPQSDRMVVDVINRGINPYTQYQEYLQLATNPELEFIISNTTEAGIAFNEEDRYNDAPPASFPAKLTVLLHKRFEHFNGDHTKGLFIIPCELIDKNADYLKKYILQYAKQWNLGDDFIYWVEQSNHFCNSLVDRIVPGYPKDRIEEVKAELPYEDQLVNEAEQFHLWVIEGGEELKKRFPVEKTDLNVLIVPDASDYKTRKVRILNGSHTALCPISILAGIETVREAMEDADTMTFLAQTLNEEIIPTLTLPKPELEQFAADVLDRFRNPFIKHYWMSISLNSMSKFETRVLPSLLTYQKANGKLPKRLTFALAATIAFYEGYRGAEKLDIKDNDDIMALYAEAWQLFDGDDASYQQVVEKVLGYEANWKMDLNKVPGLTEAVTAHLTAIERQGMREALKTIIA
ncbi:MAG: tagaturonate reductase [Breznakibacter sp.]